MQHRRQDRILIVHNHYRSSAPSGENVAFASERDLLIANGHEVSLFEKFSDSIASQGTLGLIATTVQIPWSVSTSQEFSLRIRAFKPDIVHVHNVFPLISPSIFYAAKKHGVTTILTLHNFRIFCAAGIPLRNGRTCTECLERRSVIPSIIHGCYRRSRVATLPLAAGISLHRCLGTWANVIDGYIALSAFQKDQMVKAGLPADRVSVKPHFLAPVPKVVPYPERARKAVFVGRLAEEKGVKHLIAAWSQIKDLNIQLEIVGDGPERQALSAQANACGIGKLVLFRGMLSGDEAQRCMSDSNVLVLPTLCAEGFPMVVREAFALGVPVIASRIGSVAELVEQAKAGLLFTTGDEIGLANSLRQIFTSKQLGSQWASNARAYFEANLTAQTNYQQLVAIYKRASSRNC